MFTDTVRVLWDNSSAGGSCCLPNSSAGATQYPIEAELRIDADQVWWTSSVGRVTTISRSLIFGATRVSQPLPAVTTRKSASVLSKSHVDDEEGANLDSQYWLLHAVELSDGRTDKPPGIRRILFESLTTGAKNCVDAVQDCAGIRQTVRSVMVIVNPFGGTKKALKIYNTIVKPMLELAGIRITMKKTAHIGHATTIAKMIKLDEYSAVVTVSGDGVFHEVINGLLTRPDWELASKLPVGVIGGGSANAMNKNLATNYPELATLAVIKGQTRPMDVFSVTQGDTVMYSHLQVMWAFLADLDFESEQYRWLGGERMTLAAIIRLIRLRTYRGKLYLLPFEDAPNHENKPHEPTVTTSQPTTAPPPPPPLAKGPVRKYTADPTAHLRWPTRIDSTFNLFMATSLPWISDQFLACPQARLANGALDVIWSERMSAMQTLGTVLDQGSGAYLSMPFIETRRVKALVLEPYGWSWDRDGRKDVKEGKFMDVSGEQVEYGTTRVEIHPSAMNVITPEWLDEEEWTRIAEKARKK